MDPHPTSAALTSKTAVGTHPPPWQLTGRGYLLLMRFPGEFLREHSFLSPALKPSFRSALAMVMFMDYVTTDCGPYRELLLIPGQCAFSIGHRQTISKIYVETENSVVNGQRNWGIPKERCDFETNYGREGNDVMKLHAGEKRIAELAFRPFGPKFPLVLGLLPKRWLTLGQELNGQEFIYTPQATGHWRLARLTNAWSDPARFPDLAQGKVLASFCLTDFQMVFPKSIVTPLARVGESTFSK